MVELEIEAGRPVLAGYLSAGNMLRGEPPMCSGLGCGHWLVISGFAGKTATTRSGSFKTLVATRNGEGGIIRIWDVTSE